MASKFRSAARVTMADPYKAEKRSLRRPQHTFDIRARPFQLQPFLLAPVLPGETLKNLLLQARVVTDPIKSPLVGWWQEYYFFYVKLTDLDERETLMDILTKNADPSALYTPGQSDPLYRFANTIDWQGMCLKRVVEEYFRNEGEAWNAYVIDGIPVASINSENWTNSLLAQSSLADDDVSITVGADDIIKTSEIEDAMRQWQLMKDLNFTDMTYEDFLATFGISSAPAATHKPELVRYVRNWSYPSNTVNPADGSVASAVSWSVAERADKDRFFKEPGFLFGVTCSRAKVLMANLNGAGVGMLRELMDWFPATMHDDDKSTLQGWAEGAGPLPTFNTADNLGYVVDLRDLLIYGDQFINYDPSTVTDANLVGLPTPTGQRRYLDGTEVDKLMKTAGGKIRQNGLVSLNIAGRQKDRTPGVPINV